MNKTELIKQVAQEANLTQKDIATASVQAVLDQITQALAKGDSVQLIRFGTFEVRERSARTGRNPQTGEEMFIPGGKTPAFKAGKSLKRGCKIA
jgi:DNA-binding protein HU-beta